MKTSRRDFLKLLGTGAVAVTLPKMGLTLTPCKQYITGIETQFKNAIEIPTICSYCGGGCRLIVTTKDGQVINIEGDPDHPINRGALCSKASALYQVAVNPQRLTKVLYRSSGGSSWEEKDWDWAVSKIAANIKKTRDANWIEKEGNLIVNRTEAIGNLGGAALDNEECYLISKAMRGLGIVYLEHQARI